MIDEKYKQTLNNVKEILENMDNDWQGIIDVLLDRLVETVNAETGTFWYLAHDGLIYAESTYKNAELSRVILTPGEGIAGIVIQTGKPQIVIDCQKENKWYKKADYFTGFHTKTMICVPFKINKKTVGCFQLINRRGDALFDEADLSLAESVSKEISNIFEQDEENARLALDKLSRKTGIAISNNGSFSDIKLIAKTFGNFEIFSVGSPLKFKYEKAKELLAALIDNRGALLSNNEIITTLWEDDDDHQSYLRTIKKDLIDTLKTVDADGIVVCQRGKMGIIPDKLKCDYYEYLKGENYAVSSYAGEYMRQYSWAEFTNANLSHSKFSKNIYK